MKLKKIASLALAGVMAVSMLAGCATQEPAPTPDEGEDQGTVATTGYSATLDEAVGLSEAQAEYISFADNADDQAALQKAVAAVSTETLKAIAQNWVTVTDASYLGQQDGKDALTSLKKELNTKAPLSEAGLDMASYADGADVNVSGVRTGVVYTFNGGVDTEYALNQIAENVAKYLDAGSAPKSGSGTNTTWNYTYTVSASVVTRAQQDNYVGSANTTTFVLVTISRNVTNA